MKKDTISFSDFQKLDLRVGKVLKAEIAEGSRNLIRMEVDLGTDYGIKKILAGLAGHFKSSNLKGKKFIFVANLEPKQMMHELSEGMILVADSGEDLMLVPVGKTIPEGTVVR